MKPIDEELLLAAARCDAAAVRRLLTNGGDPGVRSPEGFNLFELALHPYRYEEKLDGPQQTVAALVDLGVDPATAALSGKSLIESAAWEGNAGLVAMLRSSGIAERDPDEALRVACGTGDWEGVQEAVAGGARVASSDGLGYQAIHYCALGGHAVVLEYILHAGADPNVPGGPRGGMTPLYAAAMQGHLESVRILLAAGADPDRADTDGNVPAVIAALNGWNEIVDLLCSSERPHDSGGAP